MNKYLSNMLLWKFVCCVIFVGWEENRLGYSRAKPGYVLGTQAGICLFMSVLDGIELSQAGDIAGIIWYRMIELYGTERRVAVWDSWAS